MTPPLYYMGYKFDIILTVNRREVWLLSGGTHVHVNIEKIES